MADPKADVHSGNDQSPEHLTASDATSGPVGQETTKEPEIFDTPRWNKHDTSWVISLFGTAVGAGILFLPIRAGAAGLWPLVVMTLLIGPMTYFSHRALSRIICKSPRMGDDITLVVEDYFGSAAGKLITVLYFFAIYPIVLIYGVSITNTVDSLLVNQLGISSPPRWILSAILIAALMAVMLSGEKIILMVTGWVVYPLIAILIGVSLYLVPQWDLSGLTQPQPLPSMLMTVWLTIPVLVFAFNHSPAISQFSLAMQRHYGYNSAEKASKILRANAIMLVLFTMGFVWSCVLALGPTELGKAREANLPVLSYIANVMANPIISYLGPIVAITAIVSSFFGHYFGAAEGAVGIVRAVTKGKVEQRSAQIGVAVFMFLTTWGAAVANPSILGLIETISGPVIASILYLMPMYAIHKVPALKPYRGKLSNVFITIAGLFAVGAIIVTMVQSFM
ncbi:Serine transporter [Dermatophilus congolensis]|uniref:Serine transporter n=1 Tax=Dermatophilus congolensis TaxID=1863 RepID=A0A239V5N8_9MICO|nr:HAAAP family serine/threonine permease [Dermatophilus congolensis]SNV16783.1 Serine transporter [Dermatophilus congolensis]